MARDMSEVGCRILSRKTNVKTYMSEYLIILCQVCINLHVRRASTEGT